MGIYIGDKHAQLADPAALLTLPFWNEMILFGKKEAQKSNQKALNELSNRHLLLAETLLIVHTLAKFPCSLSQQVQPVPPELSVMVVKSVPNKYIR